MREGGGAAKDGGTIGGELGDGLRGEIGEEGDVDRDLVVEEADAAADGGAIVGGRSVNKTEARCDVEGIGRETVLVEAHAELEDQAGMDLPTILHKKSEFVAGGSGGKQWMKVNDPAAESAVLTKNVDGQIGKEALISGAREGIAERNELTTVKFERAKMEIL